MLTPTTAAFGRWSSVAPPFSATVPLIARRTPPTGMANRAAARKRTPAGNAPGEPALNRTTSENPDETVFTLAKREDHTSSRPPVDPLVTPWFRGRGRPDSRNDNA